MSKKIIVNLNIPVLIFREGNYFIASTSVLDISTQGNSAKEARVRFTELVQIFLSELVNKGTLEDELISLGWSKTDGTFQPPIQISNENVTIPVEIDND